MHNFLEKIFGWLYPLLRKISLGDLTSAYISLVVNIFILCVIAYVIYVIFRLVLVALMAIIARKTKTHFDDLLVSNQTAKYIAHLIPFLFIYKSVPIILENYDYWESVFGKMVGVYIVLLSLWIVRSILKATSEYLKEKPRLSDKPIDSYIQVIMIILWIFCIGIIISKIFDINLNTLFGVLGAISAIILLIFRDTILGFVASVQVSLNDMVRMGM